MLAFEPLETNFGARATGIPADLRALDATERTSIRNAFDQHGLLLFRGRVFGVDEQLSMCRAIGEPADESGDGTKWSVLSNRATGAGAQSRLRYHSDFIFAPQPLLAISLYAQEIPAAGTATLFADTSAVCTNLPLLLREELKNKSALQCVHLRVDDRYETPTRTVALAPDDPRNSLPVIHRHPRTGDPILTTAELHTQSIDGLSAQESDAMLVQLSGWVERPEFGYRHEWQIDDLIIWDNLRLQHARDTADTRQGTRSLRRVIVALPEWSVAFEQWLDEFRALRLDRASNSAEALASTE